MKKLFFLLLSVSILTVNAQETAKEFKNLGVEKYKAKDYTASLEAFTKAIELNETEGTVDTALFYNAASSAYKSKNYEKLALYADKTIELKYTAKGSKNYLYSAIAYKKLKNDSLEEKILREGLEKYPNSKGLKKKLSTRVLKNGNVYYSNAVDFQTKANANMKDQAKFDGFIEKAMAEFELAKPMFEESYNLNPANETASKLLKIVYDNLKTPDADRLVKL